MKLMLLHIFFRIFYLFLSFNSCVTRNVFYELRGGPILKSFAFLQIKGVSTGDAIVFQ